jgi:hypothetical protein
MIPLFGTFCAGLAVVDIPWSRCMRVTLLITAFVLAGSPAIGQEPPVANPPPAADAAVLPAPGGTQPPAVDDPVGRIENRLDQIERRLGEQSAPGAPAAQQATGDAAAVDTVNSRYRYHDGVWWYWLPSNRWVYWSNGAWVDFVPTTQPSTVIYRSAAPAYSYVPSYGYTSAYSYPQYYSSYGGYYPGYSSYYGSGYGYYPRYGGYYGGGWGSAIGLGLAIGSAFSHNHHHHHHGHHHHHRGHFHGGHHHGHHHGHHQHHRGHLGGHRHHHGGHHRH